MSQHLSSLRILEDQLQQVSSQKRSYNRQVMEFENALSELQTSTEAYHIVGNVMVKKSSADLKKQLEHKKEIATIRLQTLEKQEQELEKEVTALQQKVLAELDK